MPIPVTLDLWTAYTRPEQLRFKLLPLRVSHRNHVRCNDVRADSALDYAPQHPLDRDVLILKPLKEPYRIPPPNEIRDVRIFAHGSLPFVRLGGSNNVERALSF